MMPRRRREGARPGVLWAPEPGPRGTYRVGDRVRWYGDATGVGVGVVVAVAMLPLGVGDESDAVPLPEGEAHGPALGQALARRVVLTVRPDRGRPRLLRPWGHGMRVSKVDAPRDAAGR